MTTSHAILRLNYCCLAAPPLIDESCNRVGWDCGVIYQRDDYSSCFTAHLFDSASDRVAHLAFRIGIEREAHLFVFQTLSNLFRTMPDDDDNLSDARGPDVIEA